MAEMSVEVTLALVALVVSLAAFGLTILQSVLAYLQFDNSEGGRRRCQPEVMSKDWAAKTTSKYKWREFRYQVFFEVPVFYTAPPGITVGPLTVPKPKVTMKDWARKAINGSEDEQDTVVRTFEEEAKYMEVINMQRHYAPIYKITGTESSCKNTMTAYTREKDEKWALHTAEDEGCSWIFLLDALQGQERVSRLWDRGRSNHGYDHTICYLIQIKQRCWDFMPPNATKPFATTTICHLVEIMAMLGMVWTDFDPKASLLTAEGNGYMVKTENMSGLGIIARFSRLSKPLHEGNRIIPCLEVKQLCFGEVPSLFDDMGHGQALQVGPRRVEGCLAVLLPGLSPEERKCFLPKDFTTVYTEKSVLPTPTFELIAMVAKSCHIRGSRFRRLPNPCGDVPSFNLKAAVCLQKLADIVKKSDDLGADPLTEEIRDIFRNGIAEDLKEGDTPAARKPLEQLVADYITAEADFLKTVNSYDASPQRDWVRDAKDKHVKAQVQLLDALSAASDWLGDRLTHADVQEDLRSVLSAHFSTVLAKTHRDALREVARSSAFERDLVEYYFDNIRPAVVRRPVKSEEDSTASSTLTLGAGLGPMTGGEPQRSAVWVALMFRMWAWMFLHEFNPLDKMIERTEFMNSRLPVYIG